MKYYGDGDAELGMVELKNRIFDESIGTDYLSGEYGSYANSFLASLYIALPIANHTSF